MLIAINGPIASGKSTIAQAVADALRRGGTSAAVLDIDLLYTMLDPRSGVRKDDDRSWTVARRGAAALADAFMSDGVEVVIAEGALFRDERAEFMTALGSSAEPCFVTLRVSYEEALRRAKTDPTRGVSRDPAFLGPYFEAVTAYMAQVPKTDLVIDTETRTVAEAVGEIVARCQPITRGL
jgi:adenylylsulfate kinase-like enzyme